MSAKTTTCDGKTEVYSRVTGFYRPVQTWNQGKMAEFSERRTYKLDATAADETEARPAVAQMG